jgi:hypothetical protein
MICINKVVTCSQANESRATLAFIYIRMITSFDLHVNVYLWQAMSDAQAKYVSTIFDEERARALACDSLVS